MGGRALGAAAPRARGLADVVRGRPACARPAHVCAGCGARALSHSSAETSATKWASPKPYTPLGVFHVAPMMDYTDRHFRTMARLISKTAVLWTEMVVDKALVHNARQGNSLDRFLAYDDRQHPLVLQLGGSDPGELGDAVKLALSYGYDEINLNCGCPSEKVAGHGSFGAALFSEPARVAELCTAMQDAGHGELNISVKHRIGLDDVDSYEAVRDFVGTVTQRSGVRHFVVHARKAILGGLSPADNRRVPPLMYHRVRQLAVDFPEVSFTINGGLLSVEDCVEQMEGHRIDAVMVGRQAWSNAYGLLAAVDSVLSAGDKCLPPTRREVLAGYMDYAVEMQKLHPELRARTLARPLVGLFLGVQDARQVRRAMEQATVGDGKAVRVDIRRVQDAVNNSLSDLVLDARPGIRVDQGGVETWTDAGLSKAESPTTTCAGES